MNPRDVPIPFTMRHLPLDKRGYPIIPIILSDNEGPKFSLNDEAVRQQMFATDCCGICGNKLWRARWLVGGPGSAFLEWGAYLDPPMHTECMHYALQVCPYLAAPRWSGAIGRQQAANVKLDPGNSLVLIGDGSDPLFPGRPEIFVAVQYVGKLALLDSGNGMLVSRPPRPYRRIEYWSGGKQMSEDDGIAATLPIVKQMLDQFEEEHGVPTTYSNLPK